MLVFVTVGSTKFDLLVQAILSEPILRILHEKGYTRLVLQCGNSQVDFAGTAESFTVQKHDVDIEIWKFKPSLQDDYMRADLVISHAGSGTILDVLRLGKPLIVIPNPSLLDNHQEELASALATLGHLKATPVYDLSQAVATFEPSSLVPFPAFDGSKFQKLLDEEMGF